MRSISVDLHKYGFAAKGASAALFRHKAWRPSYAFEFDDWPIGTYGSVGLAGTRSAVPIAAAWAVMRYLGEEGYVRIATAILGAFERLKAGLGAIEGVEIVGRPDLPVLAWKTPGLAVDRVIEEMTSKGWFLRPMARPSARRGLPNSTLSDIHYLVLPACLRWPADLDLPLDGDLRPPRTDDGSPRLPSLSNSNRRAPAIGATSSSLTLT